ncbi:MAG: hypothetical protein OXI66_01680 [Boseongicola sp.]|nr:hypothetical protein [Boseongicola sp.]
MATESKKRLSKIARQKLRMRDTLWPELDEARLWSRERSDGWLSVPRPMPLLMKIMDSLSKGKPVSSTYLDLWCRTYDDSFIIANKDREMAYFSGFSGERAVRTWTMRMRTLKDLGFIDIKSGPNGPISYVLIFNPYLVVRQLYEAGQINESFFNSLAQRMIEIGAHDLSDPPDEEEAKPRSVGSRRRRRARKATA